MMLQTVLASTTRKNFEHQGSTDIGGFSRVRPWEAGPTSLEDARKTAQGNPETAQGPPETPVGPKGGQATRGWCNRFGIIEVWGYNTSGACNTFRGANVLLHFRLQHITCNTMQYNCPESIAPPPCSWTPFGPPKETARSTRS
eukprot:6749417-Pyramimonas_sp.AAC.1